MDRIQVCRVDAETVEGEVDLSESGFALHTVGSISAALDLIESHPIDCLVTEWLDATDRESVLAACRRHDVAVVWITDHPEKILEADDSDWTDYLSTADAARGPLVAHRIRSAVAVQTCGGVDEPSTVDSDQLSARPATSESADDDQPTPSATAVIDGSQAGTLVFDAQGRITQLNPAAEEILGLPAAEAIGNNCESLDMRTPENRSLPQSDRPVARVLDTGEPIRNMVVSVPDQSGGRQWLSISASPLADGRTVDGVVVTLEDVSTEIELETTLQTVLDRMTDGFIAFDTDLRLTYASKQAINTDRYPDSEYLGARLADLGEHLAQYEADLQEVLDTQEPKTVETYVPEPTDQWVRARLYPSETGVSVFFREVTEEKQREREFKQYKTIVESVRDGVCILDANFEFVFVNEAFTDLVGYNAEELLGRSAEIVIDPDDMELAYDRCEQLFAGNSEAAILDGKITTKAGTRVPVETWMTPIQFNGERGTVGVVRDLSYRKQTEAMFTALYDAAHELLSVRSDQEIAEIAVDAATAALGFESAIALGYDDETNVFEPLAYTPTAAGKLPELLPIAADTTSIAGRAYFESECIETEDLSEHPDAYDPETAYRRALFVPLGEHGVLFVGDTEAGSTSDQTLTVAELLGATVAAAFDRLAADQQSQTHRQTLAKQTRELERLRGTNKLVTLFVYELLGAQSREDIETVACSVLADHEAYDFAWIGTNDQRDEPLSVRAAAGHDGGYLDWLETQLREVDQPSDEPTLRALASDIPISVDQISRNWQQEPWRKEALSRGYQSVFSIPLTHNEISYGVLSVYAGRPAAFDEHSRTVLTTIGQVIAYVIASTETKQGLLADNRTELEITVNEDHDILQRLAHRLDGHISFEGVVPQRETRSLLYFSATDVSADAVATATAELHSIDSLRAVTEQNGTTLYEASVSGSMLATTVVDCGALPISIEADGGGQQVVVTLPQSTDVRTFMQRLKADYPSATIVSRQNREYGLQTRETFRMKLLDVLTERQEEALRTAYFARYFDSPRGTTGTELGASLGISQPTVNYHLRAALRALLALLFEEPETLDT